MKESTVFTRKYCTELTSLSMLKVFEVEVWCFRGGNEKPRWIERRSGASSFHMKGIKLIVDYRGFFYSMYRQSGSFHAQRQRSTQDWAWRQDVLDHCILC